MLSLFHTAVFSRIELRLKEPLDEGLKTSPLDQIQLPVVEFIGTHLIAHPLKCYLWFFCIPTEVSACGVVTIRLIKPNVFVAMFYRENLLTLMKVI